MTHSALTFAEAGAEGRGVFLFFQGCVCVIEDSVQ